MHYIDAIYVCVCARARARPWVFVNHHRHTLLITHNLITHNPSFFY